MLDSANAVSVKEGNIRMRHRTFYSRGRSDVSDAKIQGAAVARVGALERSDGILITVYTFTQSCAIFRETDRKDNKFVVAWSFSL